MNKISWYVKYGINLALLSTTNLILIIIIRSIKYGHDVRLRTRIKKLSYENVFRFNIFLSGYKVFRFILTNQNIFNVHTMYKADVLHIDL